MANKGTNDDQQRETSGSPLPSYGLSKLCDITNADTVKAIMDGVCQGTLNLHNMQRVHTPLVGKEELSSRSQSSSLESSTSENASSAQEMNENITGYHNLVKQESGSSRVKVEQMPNSYVLPFLGYLGNTEPHDNEFQSPDAMATEDDDQLFGEGVAMEVTVLESQMEELLDPKVTFTDVAKYSRFRYESERSKSPRAPKGKPIDHNDDYKSLGTIKIEGCPGPTELTIFCVDSTNRLHPFSLYGDHCENGIYHQTFDLKTELLVRLNKVTIMTPKSKEYKNIFSSRREELYHNGIDVKNMNNADMDKSDKNIVYLHAEVRFGDRETRKYALSTAIHNKKEGHEFKIYTIEPSSAPPTGYSAVNINKNRVLIVLSEATACPKNVTVKIKAKTGRPWVKFVPKKDVKVIRKSVVEFLPPPFWNVKTETAEECFISLVDEDTKDETNCVTFIYKQDSEGIEERRRKKPRLDTTQRQVSRQLSSTASIDVLESLMTNMKDSSESMDANTDKVPRYSDVMLGKQKQEGISESEKIYSLKDSSRSDGLVARSPPRTPVQANEGVSRDASSKLQVQGPKPATGLNPDLQQSQLTTTLPDKSSLWPQGPQPLPAPSITSQFGALTNVLVTSTSGMLNSSAGNSTGNQPVAPAFPPHFEQPQQTSVPPQTQPTTTIMLPQAQFQQQPIQVQAENKMPEWKPQQIIQQPQTAQQQQQTLQEEAQLQPQQQYQQQAQPGQQIHQPVNQQLVSQQQQQVGQQQQQIQQLLANSKPQFEAPSTINEKRLKHEVLSAFLEKEAKKMNPDFQLAPNQMFLLLGDKITIADRSLVDIVFAATGNPQVGTNLETQLQGIARQLSGQIQSIPTYNQPGQSVTTQLTGQLYGTNPGQPPQPPPFMQQVPHPQLQTMMAGGINQYPTPSSLAGQQYPGTAPPLQQGASIGFQQNYTAGQGTMIQQNPGQPRTSIFPRNNLPFSSANLDDDDVEIDSEGPKRKKPVQLYDKTSKKQANGSTMKTGIPSRKESTAVDLTMRDKSNIDNINDNDLETDCHSSKSHKLNVNKNGVNLPDKIILKKFTNDFDKVDKANREVESANESGIFSMPAEQS